MPSLSETCPCELLQFDACQAGRSVASAVIAVPPLDKPGGCNLAVLTTADANQPFFLVDDESVACGFSGRCTSDEPTVMEIKRLCAGDKLLSCEPWIDQIMLAQANWRWLVATYEDEWAVLDFVDN
jgi:hypothetical protein